MTFIVAAAILASPKRSFYPELRSLLIWVYDFVLLCGLLILFIWNFTRIQLCIGISADKKSIRFMMESWILHTLPPKNLNYFITVLTNTY